MTRKKIIAVVDDDPQVLDLIREFLPRYQIRQYMRPLDLLFALEQQSLPDLIIADIVMDGLDGYGLCRKIKKQSTLSGIPFLLISGYTEQMDFQKAVESGADEYLGKPFNMKELQAYVSKQLGETDAEPVVSPLNE